MAKKRDHLVKEMRELACSRQPGSRFFTIRELMKRFSVSQLLVYKALDQLKADGLLVTHDGNELYVTEESALRQHLRLPSILVAIPHWKSWVTDQVIRLVAEPKPLCPGYRTELIEYDPLKAVPDVLPIEREKAVGAVLFASGAPLTPEDIARMTEFSRQFTFTVIGQHLEDFGIPSVGVDDAFAANLAMNHLIRAGHRKIGILYCEPHSRVMELRCRSAVDYAKLHEVEVDLIDCGIRAGELANAKTYDRMRGVIRRGFDFTALLGLSGEPLLSAVEALEQAGIDIPGKLSVAAIAAEQLTARHDPPINTVGVLMERQLRTALQMVTPNAVPVLSGVIRPELFRFGSVQNLNSKQGETK